MKFSNMIIPVSKRETQQMRFEIGNTEGILVDFHSYHSMMVTGPKFIILCECNLHN